MKEREFEIITPDDEIFENLGDLGAFRTGGRTEKEIEDDYREKTNYVEENLWSKVQRSRKENIFCKRSYGAIQLYERSIC